MPASQQAVAVQAVLVACSVEQGRTALRESQRAYRHGGLPVTGVGAGPIYHRELMDREEEHVSDEGPARADSVGVELLVDSDVGEDLRHAEKAALAVQAAGQLSRIERCRHASRSRPAPAAWVGSLRAYRSTLSAAKGTAGTIDPSELVLAT